MWRMITMAPRHFGAWSARPHATERTKKRIIRLSCRQVSPPYLTAIDYLRGHRLALVWFGSGILDQRSVRAGSIGAESSAIRAGVPDIDSRLVVAGEIDASGRPYFKPRSPPSGGWSVP